MIPHNPISNEQDLPGFYSIDQFAFLKEIESKFNIIKQEWESSRLSTSLYQTWPQKWIINNPLAWDMIPIRFQPETSHIHQVSLVLKDYAFPKTLEILSNVLNGRLGDVAVSRIQPGTKILPHQGIFGPTLRCHLGLQIPAGDCKIKVNNEIASWAEGKILILDDRLTHEVWNNTDQERTILIFDFVPGPIPGFLTE
jgi:aspartyl/asparaginyl beta-hydroxylase (cupin superfamily)